ncbi:hypothetical protein [Sphingopyxis sp. RIFCSPHIGHO2_12_FULL_65_19]|uniref:hypothetical protein n=1 Tax=Sphingopyxis sp. RIFCSPHIGHO2_12_FULL_65_19 TaxID=1802172 RepID=UPI0008C1CF1D|nr:hypothetical protein [Sphingopyxis sp. RIFCSPHIGHO2_12_FULL_65_19]OHD10166.1 MAG: hypothetical protein A3E77_06485 [Sphingopyxis sp. RIFCSPHIGHO2_12_FULL_65_19]
MADPAPGPARPEPRPGAGCVAAGALFGVVAILGWLIAITAYGLVVEQWEMIAVRRDFSYDWVFVWAPLFAIGLGLATALLASRRAAAARMTLLITVTGAIALLAGVVLFGLGGLI